MELTELPVVANQSLFQLVYSDTDRFHDLMYGISIRISTTHILVIGAHAQTVCIPGLLFYKEAQIRG